LAIDPVVEATSDKDSYGFRLYRSTHDCICRIKTLLDKKYSPTWILEADIEKCFDKINHEFLIANTIVCDKKILVEWLKSGYSEYGIINETEAGIPQGGVISPLLCNIALNGVESYIKNWGNKLFKHGQTKSKTHLIRYADDLIILGKSKENLETLKAHLSIFLAERGLKVKESKTRILEISEGFDFLGFNIKKRPINYKFNTKYKNDSIIVIKPSIKSIKKFKEKIKKITKEYGRPMQGLISIINPVIRGWSEYFRISYYSTITFWKMGHYIWKRMMIWMSRKHPNRTIKYLINKYVVPGKQKWNFGISATEKIYNISEVTSWWPTLLKLDRNPYIIENKSYYENRQIKRVITRFRSALYKKYSHICQECGESLYNGENVEMHHILPQKKGGTYKIDNIIPLHEICHKNVTIREIRKESANNK